MNTLYLRVAPRHTASWPNGALPYALCSVEGSIMREGSGTLSELATYFPKAIVTLIIAASDVTLLELVIPPMPEAKLKLALPNLVEDQLMADPADCVLMLGAKPADSSGRRAVAVAQRAWLQQLSDSLFALGATQIRAIAAQLCLPLVTEQVDGQSSAALFQYSQNNELAIRTGEERGIGMLQEAESTAEDFFNTVAMLAPAGPVTVYLPAPLAASFKQTVSANPELSERFIIQELKWSTIAKAARSAGFNLIAGLNHAQTNRIQWKIWRWPLVLVSILLLVNVGALNYDYWNLKRESDALKSSMVQTYKKTFPKDTVVLFPLEQMRKNLDTAQRGSGQPGPDDFTLLLAEFGQAWSGIPYGQQPKLVSIEFKDRALVIQVKGPMPQKELQAGLDEKGLVLKKNNSEVWQVRNAK